MPRMGKPMAPIGMATAVSVAAMATLPTDSTTQTGTSAILRPVLSSPS